MFVGKGDCAGKPNIGFLLRSDTDTSIAVTRALFRSDEAEGRLASVGSSRSEPGRQEREI
jgi:hypothetical protein